MEMIRAILKQNLKSVQQKNAKELKIKHNNKKKKKLGRNYKNGL